MTAASTQRLLQLGLLKAVPAGQPPLRALCAAGALQGGLSVALDVRPADLVGPLCSYLGGPAAQLRVLDTRTTPPEVWVRIAGKEARWPTPDVAALVTQLNRCYQKDVQVPAIARLGSLDGAEQLWCIPKRVLKVVLQEEFFEAENARELSALSQGNSSFRRGERRRRGSPGHG